MKFGGSSLSNGENVRNVANLINDYCNQGYSIVVVISALESVTDKLDQAAEQAKIGNKKYIELFKEEIMEKHLMTAKRAIKNKQIKEEIENIIKTTIDELTKVLTGIFYIGELTSKSRDYVLSFGERLSTSIVWGTLRDLGIDTQYYTGNEAGIVTNNNFGEATPLLEVTKRQVKKKIEPLLEKGIVPVITGFIAATQDNVITSLGRGGSDYTATIIGASIRADEIWIWTDVDGLMTFDPKILTCAKLIPELSFQEATEMTIFGAKSMHPKALEPAMEENIPVRIKNTFNPKNPGTLILDEQKIKRGEIVKAISLVKDVALVNVSGAGMVGQPGTAAKIFQVLGDKNINILMISQSISEASISFIIHRNSLSKAFNVLNAALLDRGLIREVSVEDDVCVVAAVGAGMKSTPGVASRIFSVIARKGINIRMIAQGSSELNISFVVKETEGVNAVRAIHEEFNLDHNGFLDF